MKKAIAMRCTKEQFEAIEPKLKGFEIDRQFDFMEDDSYLTNNYDERDFVKFTFVRRNREVFETWNEKIFLEACGISTIPTLEEVKEYFKDAALILDKYSNQQRDISDFDLSKVYYGTMSATGEDVYCKDKNGFREFRLYDDYHGFSEILTTKQKTYTLTEDQLRSLTDPAVKKMFPEVFPETVLEVGKFYKAIDLQSGCLGFPGVGIFTEEEIKSGFTLDVAPKAKAFKSVNGRVWGCLAKDYIPATEEEIQTALEAEKIKRGLTPGAFYKCVLSGKVFQVTKDFYKTDKKEGVAFLNGIWAEVVTLEKGKYYTDGAGWFCFDGNFDQDGSVCGFGVTAVGDWKEANLIGWGHGGLIEMQAHEIEYELKLEATKRGFGKKGVWFLDFSGLEISEIEGFDFWNSKKEFLVSDSARFNISVCQNAGVIFRNGIWSKIVTPELTKSEAETKFNIKIKE